MTSTDHPRSGMRGALWQRDWHPLAECPVGTVGGEVMHRRGFLKTRLPEPDRVRPHPSLPICRLGSRPCPGQGGPVQAGPPPTTPHDSPDSTPRRFSQSAVGTPCSGKHFWKNLEPKHFSTKPLRNPDHFQSQLTLKPDTLNPLFEFVSQSFETKIF